MTLTKEQIDFGTAKNTTITDTAANLMDFLKPINEEGRIIKEFKSSLLGEISCLGSLGWGCGTAAVVAFVVAVLGAIVDLDEQELGKYCILSILVFTEFFLINYIYNTIFNSKHKGAPEDPDKLNNLIVPFIGFLSQDLKEDEKITVKSALLPLESSDFMLDKKEIQKLGKRVKSGLNVYSGDLLELTTRLADGTSVAFNVSEVLSTVFVYKKHGPNKHSRKEKVTIKVALAFPGGFYGGVKSGNYSLDDDTKAIVDASGKNVKVIVKKVISDASEDYVSNITYQQILDGCIDAMAGAYSIVG